MTKIKAIDRPAGGAGGQASHTGTCVSLNASGERSDSGETLLSHSLPDTATSSVQLVWALLMVRISTSYVVIKGEEGLVQHFWDISKIIVILLLSIYIVSFRYCLVSLSKQFWP